MSDQATADPYAGIDLPKPPRGYRLAKWGEESRKAMWWFDRQGEWVIFGWLCSGWFTNPAQSIFAVQKPRIRLTFLEARKVELEQGEEVE